MSMSAVARRCLWPAMLSLLLGQGYLMQAQAQQLPVTPNTTRITVGQLLAEMAEPSQSRSDAIDMYLLGIFDQTEGTVWCDYRQFKIDTLRDAVYGQLRELQGEALSQRAAPAVSAVLAQRFPCRG